MGAREGAGTGLFLDTEHHFVGKFATTAARLHSTAETAPPRALDRRTLPHLLRRPVEKPDAGPREAPFSPRTTLAPSLYPQNHSFLRFTPKSTNLAAPDSTGDAPGVRPATESAQHRGRRRGADRAARASGPAPHAAQPAPTGPAAAPGARVPSRAAARAIPLPAGGSSATPRLGAQQPTPPLSSAPLCAAALRR